MSQSADSAPQDAPPGLLDLFLGFSGIAIMGFGGVLPWARRMLVDQRRWMDDGEFAELLSLCQFLPGGNIINIAVVVGQRSRGAVGSAVAVAGLMAAPVAIVMLLGSLYLRYSDVVEVQDALAGIAAAAAGLILAMAAKMARPLFHRRSAVALLFAAATFLSVGVLGLSLPVVVLVLAPLSIAVAWLRPA